MNCTTISTQVYEPGVSYELAQSRKDVIKNLKYQLFFQIPESSHRDVIGNIKIEFDYLPKTAYLILDFQANDEQLLGLKTNSAKSVYSFSNQHIIIPSNTLKKGRNTLEIDFICGTSSLNRFPDYLYTLFVPDKASIVFPCFDQPDLKAKFQLRLSIPELWLAVSNGGIVSDTVNNGIRTIAFTETAPISTYLFAFAAGEFEKLSQTKNGRTINFYHRESDTSKVIESKDVIFDMHFMAIDWMEEYTGIPFPFEKLDFVMIPSFPFSGMEHVGAIFYRDSRMLLSKSASIEEIMKRATTITHEVSHMWFGDLVTMKWFDDVWLKEVYAELLAGKMINPLFPEMNHDLNFITTNYPRAYQTDQSAGTHPIKQKLENLNFAGTLYDDIIYYKAPIVMSKLEKIIGEKALQDGLKEYLATFKYGNASWKDLIGIINKYTEVDLAEWSKIWVEQEGMPIISANITYGIDGKISEFLLNQNEPSGKGRIWEQNIDILTYKNGQYKLFPAFINSEQVSVNELIGIEKPDFILLNGSGYGYGYFILDDLSKQFLLQHIQEIDNELVRAISYITLYQALVNDRLHPAEFINMMSASLIKETAKQSIQLILDDIEKCWWQFLTQEERLLLAAQLEKTLLNIMEFKGDNESKSAAFQTLLSVFISKPTQEKFYRLWKNQGMLYGFKPSDRDYSTIALALSLRDYPEADVILETQLERIKDPERKAEMQFIMPSVSTDEAVRDQFFDDLQKPENRQQEIWVRSGLYYLNHPLRAKYSIKYLEQSLEMLEEIQQTGDIFFPKNWLAYSVGQYNSTEAAQVVKKFLNENPDYNQNLRAKILQLSDLLFRAEKVLDKKEQYGNPGP